MRIHLEDVHVANFAGGSEPVMVAARQIELTLALRTLIAGPLRLPMIEIDGAKLLLETNASGEGNWKFGARAAAPQKQQQYPDLRHFTVTDSQLLYRNGETKAESRLGIQKLDLDAPDPAAPIAIAGNGTFQERPLALFGNVGAVQEMRDKSKPYPV